MDSAIIGNCQYNALINKRGSVHWLCWPRFDSSFVFGSLLDRTQGGQFAIGGADGKDGEQSYIANTNVVRTVFADERGAFELIDFAPRFLRNNRYYKPTTLIRIVRPLRGHPLARVIIEPRYDYGRLRCVPAFGSNHLDFSNTPQPMRLTTNASLTYVSESIPFTIDKNYYFAFTFGDRFNNQLEFTCEQYLERTIKYWQTWVKHCSLPRDYQEEVIRSALVLKLHQYEDTGAIIASSTTSIPEARGSERNWDYRFCWLRDAMFSLLALQRLTQFEEMEKFVSYLRNIIEGSAVTHQRIQPVYGIGGEDILTERILDHLAGYQDHQPVRIGNQAHEHKQHDVYGEMIMAISPLFVDRRFVGSDPPDSLLTHLLDNVEKYLEADDAGLWEFRGKAQLHTFSVLMHWAGAAMAQQIGDTRSNPALKHRAMNLRMRAATILNDKCWNERVGALTQAAGTEHLDASLLMAVNIGFLRPGDSRAQRHVEAISRGLSASNGFIYRYVVRDDFGSTENAFLICSFWLAEAYARLGLRDQGLALFANLIKCANHVGLYGEDIDPKTLELWGNFPQTYSHVGLINAAFSLSRENTGPGFFNPDELSIRE